MDKRQLARAGSSSFQLSNFTGKRCLPMAPCNNMTLRVPRTVHEVALRAGCTLKRSSFLQARGAAKPAARGTLVYFDVPGFSMLHSYTMPTVCDNAICIRHWDFSETSQTVSLFGREHGMIRGLAKGAKREKSRFSGGIDLLTRGQVIAIVKPNRDLATLTDWDLQEIFWHTRENLKAHKAGLYFADLVHRMVTDHDPHSALFDALCKALKGLSNEESIEETTLQFQWALLVETGYQPELQQDAETGKALVKDDPTLAFDPKAGGVVIDTGEVGRWRVRRETVEVMIRISNHEKLIKSDSEVIHRANLLLASYLRFLLSNEPTTMRNFFPDLRTS